MSEPTVDVQLSLASAAGADPEELEALGIALRQELADLDLETRAVTESGELPPGAKAVDPFSWGALILTLAASGGVLTSLVGVLQSFLARRQNASVALEIDGDKLEVTGLSSETQAQLIAAWLERHDPRSAP